MRPLLIGLLMSVLALASVSAQSAPPPLPVLTVTPEVGGPGTSHDVKGTGLPASTSLTVVVFDPAGLQSLVAVRTDAQGNFDITLRPPAGSWIVGLYRVVVSASSSRAVSAIFVATDGKARVYEQPVLPSPWSAFNIVAYGLPPGKPVDVVVVLTNIGGDYVLHHTADANGVVDAFLWPEQLGLPFWSAGIYGLRIPSVNVSGTFAVREHPAGPNISVRQPLQWGQQTWLTFTGYQPGRFLWAVYAGMDGSVLGEFLLGQADEGGGLNALIAFPDLPSGRYLFATPYEWGETNFVVQAPTPTATLTPTATETPTATATATATATPTRKPVSHRKCTKKHGKKHCKKGRAL